MLVSEIMQADRKPPAFKRRVAVHVAFVADLGWTRISEFAVAERPNLFWGSGFYWPRPYRDRWRMNVAKSSRNVRMKLELLKCTHVGS